MTEDLTYIGPLEPFDFLIDTATQTNYLEALEDRHERYIGVDGQDAIVHPGVLISHSNATRSPSFAGPNTSWLHTQDETRFLAVARIGTPLRVVWTVEAHRPLLGRTLTRVSCTMTDTAGREILRRISWGVRGSRQRPVQPVAVPATEARSFGGTSSALRGRDKTVTPERIQLFSGWLVKNLHNDERVAHEAGLVAPVASAAQGMGYLCELMIDNFGEGWLASGHCALTFRRPVYPGDQLSTSGRVEKLLTDPPRSAVRLWLTNQHGTVVTSGRATAVTRPAVISGR